MDPLFPASYPNLLAELCAKLKGIKLIDREDSVPSFAIKL